MSGDTHPDDDADFLDEDFVVEDLGQGRELDDLFDEPAPAAAATAKTNGADANAAVDADADDLLFTDHTAKLADETPWQREGFDEAGNSNWDGAPLDLESVGVPVAPEQEEEFLADPQLDDARASFTAELDSMLQGQEEFALDSEAELEVIGGEADDGISEFEQSGPFVLDDGEGLWSDEDEAAPELEAATAGTSGLAADDELDQFEFGDEPPTLAPAASHDPYAPTFGVGELGEAIHTPDDGAVQDEEQGFEEHGVELEQLPLYAASGGGEEDLEEGWEPLPGQSVDELAEVDEVQRSDEELREEAQSFTAPNFAAAEGVEQDLEDVEGHDIYDEGEDEPEAVVIGGPGSGRRRWAGLVGTLLAATVILGGGALVVAKPELFGLRIEPQRVERVDLPRPKVDFVVVEPPRPSETQPVEPPVTAVEPTPVVSAPAPGEPPATEPQPGPVGQPVVTPPSGEPQDRPTPPVEVLGGGGAQPVAEPALPTPIVSAPVASVPVASDPVAQDPAANDQVAKDWPQDLGAASQQPVAKTEPGALARFGDGLLVGELGDPNRRAVRAIDGVMPGSRAFAQLHNGNYFIGSVKQVAQQSVTLRVEDGGEITLATADIAQLTELGSSDFDALQKATRGFVRLTNNNRLVGGILSRIADDHVVLEFRKNRVMLPRSAVGEIVSGEGDQAIRLDTTREEEGWVRRIVERELGSGLPAEVPDRRPDPAPRSTPPK